MKRWPIVRLQRSSPAAHDAAGDDRARFARLVLPHLDAAYTYARYLARDPVAAEDIVQEAFERALRAIATCRGSEKAWLMAIVRHCHHDWRRARRFEPLDDADADSDAGGDGGPADPAALDAIDRHMTGLDVRGLIERLPEPFREALVLRELQDLSYREIAEATGAPVGTVMSRLARARAMLATLLAPDDTQIPAREARS